MPISWAKYDISVSDHIPVVAKWRVEQIPLHVESKPNPALNNVALQLARLGSKDIQGNFHASKMEAIIAHAELQGIPQFDYSL